jgi:glutathione synthase/RimK-type ligase-like ATP-grasp enzyme
VILILTGPDDVHADSVSQWLSDQGEIVGRFDPGTFPRQSSLTYSLSRRVGRETILRWDSHTLNLDTVEAIWYRRPNVPSPADAVADPVARQVVTEESSGFLNDLWEALDARWLPGPPPVLQRWGKLAQLQLATSIGFEVPDTLVTNSPQDLLEFYRAHAGRIVSKRLAGSIVSGPDSPYCRYTEPVSTSDIIHVESVALSPVMSQEYVEKRLELRITVVGHEVFAAEIHSQETNRTKHDWRRYDHGKTRYLPHSLPPAIHSRCLRIIQAMGLSFGALDMVVTPDGRYVFLEVNSNGQYLWVELLTGLPITASVARWLAGDGREQPGKSKASVANRDSA